ncbi:cupin domain-containing protein [Candidatus Nitrosocosmicus sp. R]
MIHPPNVVPTSHLHPKGSEAFYIFEGDYKFLLDKKVVTGKSGDVIFVPKRITHRITVGD